MQDMYDKIGKGETPLSLYSKKRSKVRGQIIRELAAVFNKGFGISKIKTTGDLSEIIKSMREYLPINSGKLSKESKITRQACEKIASAINSFFGKDLIKVSSLTDQELCQEVSDKLYSLTVEANGEYLDILSNTATIIHNLKVVTDAIKSNFNRFKNDIKNPVAQDFHNEAIRVLESLADDLSIMIGKNKDVRKTELLEESETLKRYFTKFDGQFNVALGHIFDHTLKFTTLMAKVEKLAKKLSISMEKIKKIVKATSPVNELAKLVNKDIKGVKSNEFEEYIKAYTKLKQIISAREIREIIVKGGDDEDMPKTFNEKNEKTKSSLKEYIRMFADSLNTDILEFNLLLEKLNDKLNSEKMQSFKHMDEVFKVLEADWPINTSDDYLALLNILPDTMNYVTKNIIENQIVKIRDIFLYVQKSNPKLTLLKDISKSIDSMLSTIKVYRSKIQNSILSSNKIGGLEIAELNTNNRLVKTVGLKETIDKIRFSIRKNQLMDSMKNALIMNKEQSANYEKFVAKNVGNMKKDSVESITKELTDYMKDFPQMTQRSFSIRLDATTNDQKLIARNNTFSDDEVKMLYKLKVDAEISILETLEALDYYLYNFTQKILENPSIIKSLLLENESLIYRQINDGNDQTPDLEVSNDIALDDIINNYYNIIDSRLTNSGLKNIISIFSKIADNTDRDLFKSTFKSPIQIYDSLVQYCAFGVLSRLSNNECTLNMDSIPKLKYLPPIIKAIVGKIYVSIDLYNVFTKKTPESLGLAISPSRIIIGGNDEVKINSKILDIYVRVPLVVKYLAKQFSIEEVINNGNGLTDTKIFSEIRNLGSVSRFYKLCIIDNLSTTELKEIIEFLNILYDDHKNDTDPCRKIMSIIIENISSNIGYGKFNTINNKSFNLRISHVDNDKLLRSESDDIEQYAPSDLYTSNINNNIFKKDHYVNYNDKISDIIGDKITKINQDILDANNGNIPNSYNILSNFLENNQNKFDKSSNDERLTFLLKFFYNSESDKIDTYKGIGLTEFYNLPYELLLYFNRYIRYLNLDNYAVVFNRGIGTFTDSYQSNTSTYDLKPLYPKLYAKVSPSSVTDLDDVYTYINKLLDIEGTDDSLKKSDTLEETKEKFKIIKQPPEHKKDLVDKIYREETAALNTFISHVDAYINSDGIVDIKGYKHEKLIKLIKLMKKFHFSTSNNILGGGIARTGIKVDKGITTNSFIDDKQSLFRQDYIYGPVVFRYLSDCFRLQALRPDIFQSYVGDAQKKKWNELWEYVKNQLTSNQFFTLSTRLKIDNGNITIPSAISLRNKCEEIRTEKTWEIVNLAKKELNNVYIPLDTYPVDLPTILDVFSVVSNDIEKDPESFKENFRIKDKSFKNDQRTPPYIDIYFMVVPYDVENIYKDPYTRYSLDFSKGTTYVYQAQDTSINIQETPKIEEIPSDDEKEEKGENIVIESPKPPTETSEENKKKFVASAPSDIDKENEKKQKQKKEKEEREKKEKEERKKKEKEEKEKKPEEKKQNSTNATNQPEPKKAGMFSRFTSWAARGIGSVSSFLASIVEEEIEATTNADINIDRIEKQKDKDVEELKKNEDLLKNTDSKNEESIIEKNNELQKNINDGLQTLEQLKFVKEQLNKNIIDNLNTIEKEKKKIEKEIKEIEEEEKKFLTDELIEDLNQKKNLLLKQLNKLVKNQFEIMKKQENQKQNLIDGKNIDTKNTKNTNTEEERKKNSDLVKKNLENANKLLKKEIKRILPEKVRDEYIENQKHDKELSIIDLYLIIEDIYTAPDGEDISKFQTEYYITLYILIDSWFKKLSPGDGWFRRGPPKDNKSDMIELFLQSLKEKIGDPDLSEYIKETGWKVLPVTKNPISGDELVRLINICKSENINCFNYHDPITGSLIFDKSYKILTGLSREYYVKQNITDKFSAVDADFIYDENKHSFFADFIQTDEGISSIKQNTLNDIKKAISDDKESPIIKIISNVLELKTFTTTTTTILQPGTYRKLEPTSFKDSFYNNFMSFIAFIIELSKYDRNKDDVIQITSALQIFLDSKYGALYDFYEILFTLNAPGLSKIIFGGEKILLDVSELIEKTKTFIIQNGDNKKYHLLKSYIEEYDTKKFTTDKSILNTISSANSNININTHKYLQYYKIHNLQIQFGELFDGFIKKTSYSIKEAPTSRIGIIKKRRLFYSKIILPLITNTSVFNNDKTSFKYISADLYNVLARSIFKSTDKTFTGLEENFELLRDFHKDKISRYIYQYKCKFDSFYKKLVYFIDIIKHVKYQEPYDDLIIMSTICLATLNAINETIELFNEKPIIGEFDKNFSKVYKINNKEAPLLPISSTLANVLSDTKVFVYASRGIFTKYSKESVIGMSDIMNNYNRLSLEQISDKYFDFINSIYYTTIPYLWNLFNTTNFIYGNIKTREFLILELDPYGGCYINIDRIVFTKDKTIEKDRNIKPGSKEVCDRSKSSEYYYNNVSAYDYDDFLTSYLSILSEHRKENAIKNYENIIDKDVKKDKDLSLSIKIDDLLIFNFLDKNILPLNFTSLFKSTLFYNVIIYGTAVDFIIDKFNVIDYIKNMYLKNNTQSMVLFKKILSYLQTYTRNTEKYLKGIELLDTSARPTDNKILTNSIFYKNKLTKN